MFQGGMLQYFYGSLEYYFRNMNSWFREGYIPSNILYDMKKLTKQNISFDCK